TRDHRILRSRDGPYRRSRCQSPPCHRAPYGTPYCPHLRGRDRQDRCAGGGRMSVEVSERSFEEAIECALLRNGPDACPGDSTAVRETPPPYGDTLPGGFGKRKPGNYDRTLCLLPRDVVDFALATQPQEWEKLGQHHGSAVREQFLKRLAAAIERRG